MKKVLYGICFPVFTIVLFFGCQNRSNHIQNSPPEKSNSTITDSVSSFSSEDKLFLEGDKIFIIRNDIKELLFTNVNNVTAVRFGPDGQTIHFQRTDPNSPGCANPNAQLDAINPDDKNPPPQKAPWDYQLIGSAGTIRACGSRYDTRASGYLRDAPFFSHIKIKNRDEANLYLESTLTGDAFETSIPVDLSEDYKGWEANEPVSTSELTYFPTEGFYLEPSQKLLLNFENAFLLIDLVTHKIIDAQPVTIFARNTILAGWHSFISKKDSPLLLLVGSYEASKYLSALDISGDKIAAHSLENIGLPFSDNYFVPDIPVYEWQGVNLILHEYSRTFEDDVHDPFELSDEEINYITGSLPFPSTEENEMNNFLKKIEDRIKDRFNYDAVKCRFPGAYDGGCTGFRKEKDYIVRPGSPLIQM